MSCISHKAAGHDAGIRLIGHQLDPVTAETDDLRRYFTSELLAVDHDDVTDGAFSAGGLHRQSDDIFDLSYMADRLRRFHGVDHLLIHT